MTTIAIDASALTGAMSGIPRYIAELIPALARLGTPERYVVLRRGRSPDLSALPGIDVVSANVPLWRTLFMPYMLVRRRCQLIHFPYPALPPWLPCRSVITVHDLAFVRQPEWFSPEMAARLRRSWLPAIRRADHILAVSEFTKRELMELCETPAARITVTTEGGGERWRLAPEQDTLPHPNRGRPYVLSVGTIQPRKNYPRLIAAFAEAAPRIRLRGRRSSATADEGVGDLDLCIAGGAGWAMEDLPRIAHRLGVGDRVKLLHEVADRDLLPWYHHATALALVSLYEGFGLPLVEAMAQGVPCLTSDGSSLREVAGDAAVLANPLDVASIADGLVKVCTDQALRAELRSRGLARAQSLTWERCAQATLVAYRQVIGA